MSSDLAISVRGLGKCYTIRHNNAARHTTLAESITHRLRHPLRALQGLSGGSSSETFWALNDVSFDVNKGEVVGIIGRNGAGKSTLLKILSRITEPTAGQIDLYGRVGSLLEVGTGFHQELTGRENIFLNGAILGMTRAEIRKQFDAIVDFSGVEQFLDTPVKRYSSGMYVRLAFAVAAHLRSEILVVDEVLAVGDAEFQRKCLGKMKEVSTDGRTVLFVSHNMQSVSLLCTRAACLEGGTLPFIGDVRTAIERYQSSFTRDPEPRSAARDRHRRGTGEYRVTRAAPAKPHFSPEEPKVIRFRLERKTGPLASMFFQAFIVDSLGVIVSQTDSRLVDHRLEDAQSYECTITLRTPWLKPGEYRVDLLVVGGGIVDAFDDACRLHVSPVLPYPQSAPGDAIERCAVLSDYSWSSESGTPRDEPGTSFGDEPHGGSWDQADARDIEQRQGDDLPTVSGNSPSNGHGASVGELLHGKAVAARDFIRYASDRFKRRRGERPRIGYMGGISMVGDEDANLGDGVMVRAAAALFPNTDVLAFHHPRHEARLQRLWLSGEHYFDAVLLGGGTLINPMWAAPVAMALRQGLRVSALGTGAGSWGLGQPHTVDLSEWTDLLKQFDRIGVRGPLSQERLREIGVENVEVVGDLALSLARDRAAAPSERPSFAMNLISGLPIAGPRGATWDGGLAGALERLVGRGWEVVPFAMAPDDVQATRRFAESIGARGASVRRPRSADEFFGLIGGCHFTVSLRLHGGILSAACGVPPLLIGYRDKHLDFARTMSDTCAHASAGEDSGEEVEHMVDSLARHAIDQRQAVLDEAQRWRSRLTEYARECASDLLHGGACNPSVRPA